ncbi:MAG: S8 family serine peptidase [Verrucomicrobia bacterium]|nr:S8 family serine peptidase [Verrucomicrobiota bacterium]MBT7067214.1 S8 family serine peptidase [Verrucomicrobiota bacterium]MBT7700502.1 S8 family serine peptidase [Verrucomicrobiota bacterium]
MATVPTNAPPTSSPAQDPHPDAIPGEEVLLFYDDNHLRAFLAIAAEEGVEVVSQIDRLRAVRVRVGDAARWRRVLARAPAPIAQRPNVYVRQLPPPTPPEGVTYRPFAGSAPTWMGANTAQADWGRGIKVAVLDSPAAHGTAVASIITGRGEVRGVAPGAELVALPVLDASGVGDAFALAQGVLDAVDQGARVLNISLGGAGESPVLRDAIAYAQRQGAVVVAAAGNDGANELLYPARYPGVLSVGAVDANGRQVYFSNRGAALDLVAPGLGVEAASPEGESMPFSGTSAAAPFVAGAIAGIWSDSPELSAREVEALLTRYADDAGAPGPDDTYGHGVINVGRVRERNTPGLVDMVLVRPHVARHPQYEDQLTLTLFGQNRGTERLARVVLTADVDGAPVDLTFYDVEVGATVEHEMRLTGAGIGERTIAIRQSLSVETAEDRTPQNNAMRSTLALQSE